MRKTLIRKILIYLLALLFLYTFIHKIIHRSDFVITLYRSTLIQDEYVPFLSYLIPFIELVVFVLLFFWSENIFSLKISLITLLVFTIYFIAINNFSLYTGCSCGGIFNQLSYTEHLLVNFFFYYCKYYSTYT